VSDQPPSRIGVVAIGRNEGERLKRCLASLQGSGCPVVYVDSASTDGSPAAAAALGARVHALDLSRPFTAARARAEGLAVLEAEHQGLAYVFFVDGDCEVEADFIATAGAFLDAAPDYAVACGRRRERVPEASFYNRQMDREWDTPVGDAPACGGDALFRLESYHAAGGYDPAMVAHEEPELCARIRARGGRIARLDVAMTIHDADIHTLAAYLKRAIRGGHGYVQALARSPAPGASKERALVRRALQWPALTMLAIVVAVFWLPALLVLAGLVAAAIARDALRTPAGEPRWTRALLGFCVKWAEFLGIVRWARDRLLGRRSGALLYK
jgi:glycosyltransferase involved in cell wall biosynthesis